MSELQEATLLLINSPVRLVFTSDDPEIEENPRTPPSPSVHPTWSIPLHLLRLKNLRELVQRAADSGRAANEKPGDFRLLLQHGLLLQELASRLDPSLRDDQLILLHRACEVYGKANDVRDGRSAVVLFNWAVALSDIARLARPQAPGEAAEYLSAAALKYSAAVAIDPLNPQALNNWGLILSEFASMLPATQRHALALPAVDRFRAALRLQPDIKLTSRFSYNLGTVLYADACIMAEELSTNKSEQRTETDDRQVRAALAHAGQYIILAYALQPETKVYQDALPAVQRLLPLPFLRSGPLTVAVPGTAELPRESWVSAWFALDVHTLQSVRPSPVESWKVVGSVPDVAIDVANVSSAHVCQDPTLPEGWAIWLGLEDRAEGIYLVAPDREDAEGWVDALRLLVFLGKTPGVGIDHLQTALLARRQHQGS